MSELILVKLCPKCKQEFSKLENQDIGHWKLTIYCSKKCRINSSQQRYNQRYPEKVKARNRRYYQKNKRYFYLFYREWVNQHREEYNERMKQYMREYRKKHPERTRQSTAKALRKWRKNNPEKMNEIRRRYRLNNPEKVKARNLAKKISLGKNCNRCGIDQNLQRHHHDYSKPLDIETLCGKCDKKAHRDKK